MRGKILGVVGIGTLAIAVAAGCSGKSSGASNKVTGTIGGNTFTPKSGSFGTYDIGSIVDLGVLSDDPDFCANATANSVKANSQVILALFGQVINTTAEGVATTPGDYTIFDLGGSGSTLPANFIGAEYAMIDNSCNTPTIVYLTTAGTPTVKITKISASAVNGKAPGDVKWDTGDSTGLSFALKSCPGVSTILSGSGPTCLH